MKKYVSPILAFILLGLGLGASIALSQAPPVLTLAQADQIALKNQPEVFAAHYNALAAAQGVRAARSRYFPTAFADVTGSAANRNARLGAGALNVPSLFNRFSQGVTVDQLITDSGRRKNLVASSRFQAQAADKDAQATRFDVLLSVDDAYFEVLRAQAVLKVAKQTVSDREVVADQVSAMVKHQLKSDLDMSFAQVNLAQARLLEIQAQNNVKDAFAELTRAMGLRNQKPYTLKEISLPPAPPSSAHQLVAEAIADRPELASLRLSQESDLKFQRAERDLSFPTIVAEGDAGYLPDIEQLTRPRFIPNHYEAAAVNVEIPIFNGHLFAARREAALMKTRQAGENLREMEQRVARDVRVAWANAVTDYQRIGYSAELLHQSQLALELAQGRYKLGLSSIVALSQAQLSETQSAIQAVNAKYDFEKDHYALQYQLGLLR